MRSKAHRTVAILALAFVIASCSKQPGQPPPAAAAAPAADPSAHVVVGKAPPAVNGQVAIVTLHSQPAVEFAPPPEPPYMDQISQTFIPPMLFVRTGLPTQFRNSDDVLHNVRVRESETREGMFNVAIPTGQVYNFTFPRDGFYDVGCDIHPGMSAQIFAASSPYVVAAAADGTYEFDDVPPGPYTVTIYAGSQKIEKRVEVSGAKTEVALD